MLMAGAMPTASWRPSPPGRARCAPAPSQASGYPRICTPCACSLGGEHALQYELGWRSLLDPSLQASRAVVAQVGGGAGPVRMRTFIDLYWVRTWGAALARADIVHDDNA